MHILTITPRQVRVALTSLLVTLLVGIAVLWLFMPSMPKKITIAAGATSGLYYKFATDFQKALKASSGIEVEILVTQGSVENLQLLNKPGSKVDLALVQSDSSTKEHYPTLVSIGAVFYEPYWVWYRADAFKTEPQMLSHLKNKRFAIGPVGSGSAKLTRELLAVNGIRDDEITLLNLTPDEALEALAQGTIDATAFVVGLDAPLISQYAQTKGLQIMGFTDAESYKRRFPFLSKVNLPQHNVSFENNLPNKDIQLIAPKAVVVSRSNINPGLIHAVMGTLYDLLINYSRLQTLGEFPNNISLDLPQQSDAESYMKEGPSFLYKHLPAWLAVWVGRFLKFFIPFLIILIPLQNLLPRIWSFRLLFTIGRAYVELKKLELDVSEAELNHSPKEDFELFTRRLDSFEIKVNNLNVPMLQTEQYFNLKSHIDIIRNRIRDYRQKQNLLDQQPSEA